MPGNIEVGDQQLAEALLLFRQTAIRAGNALKSAIGKARDELCRVYRRRFWRAELSCANVSPEFAESQPVAPTNTASARRQRRAASIAIQIRPDTGFARPRLHLASFRPEQKQFPRKRRMVCRRVAPYLAGMASETMTASAFNPLYPPDLDWNKLGRSFDTTGHAVTPPLLDAGQCAEICGWWDEAHHFRKRIIMGPRGYGEGEYQYFSYPLPPVLQTLRQKLYAGLAPIANRWAEFSAEAERYPETLEAYLSRCHDAGQQRPTPLLLRYDAGGYNCLHQDLYGPLVFPIQATILLSRPGTGSRQGDFTGGEFLLVEQRPRAQSMGAVVPLEQGQAVLFAVHHRPVAGKRGMRRLGIRHGVSPVRSGRRHTLGIIFHDAA